MQATKLIGTVAAGGFAIVLTQAGVLPLGGDCDILSPGPDVIVGDLPDIQKWGTVGDITAYSFATTSCNVGDEVLAWFATTNEHPVIGQHLYRLKDRRFEQLGISWVKHGFGALAQNLCCTCRDPGTFDYLGVGCSDPYTTGLNGDQDGFPGFAGLGPRSEINASTGFFIFPYGSQGKSGDAIYKRLQVHNDDLDPALNEGALYFGEGHYVTPHDAAAGNQNNNAAYRQVMVGSFTGGGWNLSFIGSTQRQQPALQAWQDVDPSITLVPLDIPDDGRFTLGYDCWDNGDGTWHYEYALYNMNSHRSGRSFSVPIPPGVTVSNVGFHDVEHHSGEPYDGSDWKAEIVDNHLLWFTQSFEENANANALRWGTLYNFRFDSDGPPGSAEVTLALFRPGAPDSVTISSCGPQVIGCIGDLDGDGSVGASDLLSLLASWGPCKGCAADFDGNGNVGASDLLTLLANWGPCP
ncbi:MAG: hypothetical protein V3T53_04380 [Phycisphaerales bacterium]